MLSRAVRAVIKRMPSCLHAACHTPAAIASHQSTLACRRSFHMLLIVDPSSPEELARAHAAVDGLVHLAQVGGCRDRRWAVTQGPWRERPPSLLGLPAPPTPASRRVAACLHPCRRPPVSPPPRARMQDVGGTCTGEHGVGHGKLAHLEREHGLPALLVRRGEGSARLGSAVQAMHLMLPARLLPLGRSLARSLPLATAGHARHQGSAGPAQHHEPWKAGQRPCRLCGGGAH